MSESNKAVFLSYASQDADAARSICEALRAAGVEVWFDQSELRGGDAWDAKIRKQIKECALFIPIVSANTQARREGYFRLEWRLAVERMRHMDDDLPFLVPVVIDDTRDVDAFVPDRFRDVQWTLLEAGRVSSTFCERIKALLSVEAAAPPVASAGGEPVAPIRRFRSSSRGRVALGFGLLAVMALALTLWKWPRGDRSPLALSNEAPRSQKSFAAQPASLEARNHMARAWEIFEKEQNGTPEEWALAEDLGAKAVNLEPTNAEAWATYACATYGGAFTPNGRAKLPEALRRAERANALDATSYTARFALAHLQRTARETRGAAETTFRELLASAPGDRRVLRGLAYTLRDHGMREAAGPKRDAFIDEAVRLLDSAAALPGGDASALVGKCGMLMILHRYREAKAAIDAAVKLDNGPNAYGTSLQLLFQRDGKIEEATAALDRTPAEFWRKDNQVASAAWLWLCAGDPAKALTALRLVRGDLFEVSTQQNMFNGPKGLLVGWAHELAGKRALAEIEWRAALQTVELRLATAPNEAKLFFWKAWLLAALGRKDEARVALKVHEDYGSSRGRFVYPGLSRSMLERASVHLRLGDHDLVLDEVERQVARFQNPELAVVVWNRLRLEPNWKDVREHPKFVAVLGKLETLARQAEPAP